MMIEVLYFEGCPNLEPTIDFREVVSELNLRTEVREVKIRTQEEAEAQRFLGSPSVRVHGIDIEQSARERTDFAFGCRLYGSSGVPPREGLVAALSEEK